MFRSLGQFHGESRGATADIKYPITLTWQVPQAQAVVGGVVVPVERGGVPDCAGRRARCVPDQAVISGVAALEVLNGGGYGLLSAATWWRSPAGWARLLAGGSFATTPTGPAL